MTSSPLSPRVAAFIRENVQALLQLEALLLVVESRERPRSAEDLSAEMYVPAAALAGWLDEFALRGFCVAQQDGYRAPEDKDRYELLMEVAEAYLRRPVSMGRLIFGSAREDLTSLAEAFRLRKKGS